MVKHPQALPHVLRIPEYFPGQSGLKGVDAPIKLSSNENCYGASPKVHEAIAQAAKDVHLYPVETSAELRDIIATHWELEASCILTSTGSDDLIPTLLRAYLGPGDVGHFFTDSFPKYKTNLIGVGAEPITIPRPKLIDENTAFELHPDAKVFLLDNPCNPLGTTFTAAELRILHKSLPPHVILALDEAYVEFSEIENAGLKLMQEADNVVIFRTFSKAYGLAGLRTGWCSGPRAIVDAMARIKPTFPLTTPSIAGAKAAIEDRAFFDASIAKIRATRARSVTVLRKAGWTIPEPSGNFFLMHCADAPMSRDAAQNALNNAGIIVRPLTLHSGEDVLRITIGTDNQMDLVLRILAA